MNKKLKDRLIRVFKEYSDSFTEFGNMLKTDLKNLNKEQQLSYGIKFESVKTLSLEFYILCTIVKEDFGKDLKEIMPEIQDLYNIQMRAKTERIPETDEQLVKFKEYLKSTK